MLAECEESFNIAIRDIMLMSKSHVSYLIASYHLDILVLILNFYSTMAPVVAPGSPRSSHAPGTTV